MLGLWDKDGITTLLLVFLILDFFGSPKYSVNSLQVELQVLTQFGAETGRINVTMTLPPVRPPLPPQGFLGFCFYLHGGESRPLLSFPEVPTHTFCPGHSYAARSLPELWPSWKSQHPAGQMDFVKLLPILSLPSIAAWGHLATSSCKA